MAKTNITFVTGTRADYGKIKSLLRILKNDEKYHVDVIVTGMHLLPSYGGTAAEVLTDDLGTIHLYMGTASKLWQVRLLALSRMCRLVILKVERFRERLMV